MLKVSVLMPVYKTKENYLRENIESVLNQTFTDFELLILNDSPEDKNIESVVASYQDGRIKYFVNEFNLGISKSRNKLINLAQGEYLAVVDHDDISLPNRFSKQVAYLDDNADVGVVSSFGHKIGKNSKLRKINKFVGSYGFVSDAEIKIGLMKKCVVAHPAAMIRKNILLKHEVYYEDEFFPAEDYALWCRLIPYTKFYNIPEVLLHYRRHFSNASKKNHYLLKTVVVKIHDFVARDNPDWYNKYCIVAFQVKKIRLFGWLPLLKIESRKDLIKIYLFEVFLLCSLIRK